MSNVSVGTEWFFFLFKFSVSGSLTSARCFTRGRGVGEGVPDRTGEFAVQLAENVPF